MDSMGDWKTTVKYAKVTKEFEECYKFKIFYVIQGNILSDYLKCTKKLLELGCERFAIGNLARLSERKRVDDVINIVSSIRSLVGQKPLHILGVSNLKILERIKPYITSFDSSSAIQLATMRKAVLELKNEVVKDIRDWKKRPTDFNCECNVCKNFDIFQDEHTLPVGTGERRVIRYLRAIHNAYVIWKAVHFH
jgi:tRNA-guanine family transglycosylase